MILKVLINLPILLLYYVYYFVNYAMYYNNGVYIDLEEFKKYEHLVLNKWESYVFSIIIYITIIYRLS